MGSNPTFFLILNWQFYYLYKAQGGKAVLLTTETRCEPLVVRLAAEKISHLIIFEHSQAHHLKIERVTGKLRWYEYLQWYWQKKRLASQQYLWSLTRPVLFAHSLLIAGLAESPLLTQLVHKLGDRGLLFSFFSYSLDLGALLRKRLKMLHPEITSPLIVLIDRFMRVTLLFYQKNRLVFVRECSPSSQQSSDQYMRSAVLDTLRYIEKNLFVRQISPIFFVEGSLPLFNLQQAFQQALFFSEASLATWMGLEMPDSFETLFDLILLSAKSPKYRLTSRRPEGSFFPRLVPFLRVMQLCTFLVLLWSFYLTYTTSTLLHKNKILYQKTALLQAKLGDLNTKIAALPLSAHQLPYMQKLLDQSRKQQAQLEQFLDLMAHALGDRYVLRSLSLSLQKSRLVIEGIDSPVSADAFLEVFQQIFHDIRFVQPSSSEGLVIESYSPFQIDL